jgi:hypothetical protein
MVPHGPHAPVHGFHALVHALPCVLQALARSSSAYLPFPCSLFKLLVRVFYYCYFYFSCIFIFCVFCSSFCYLLLVGFMGYYLPDLYCFDLMVETFAVGFVLVLLYPCIIILDDDIAYSASSSFQRVLLVPNKYSDKLALICTSFASETA